MKYKPSLKFSLSAKHPQLKNLVIQKVPYIIHLELLLVAIIYYISYYSLLIPINTIPHKKNAKFTLNLSSSASVLANLSYNRKGMKKSSSPYPSVKSEGSKVKTVHQHKACTVPFTPWKNMQRSFPLFLCKLKIPLAMHLSPCTVCNKHGQHL